MRQIIGFIESLFAGAPDGGDSYRRWPKLGRVLGFPDKPSARAAFFDVAFSLLGKVAAADGRIPQNEHTTYQAFVRKAFRFPHDEELQAFHVFYKAGRIPATADTLVERYLEMFCDQPKFLHSMLDGLVFVANVGGAPGPEAKKIIESAREAFGTSEHQLAKIESEYAKIGAAKEEDKKGQRGGASYKLKAKIRNQHVSDEDPYVLLGCSREDTVSRIKERYKEIVFTSHPDRLRAKGARQKKVEDAREQFTKILKAYDQIRREKNFV